MTDEEYEELSMALAFADGQGQLSPGDRARLLASVDRLRQLLAALVGAEPWANGEQDEPYCVYCDADLYPVRDHAPDCPWARARASCHRRE